jgi:oligoribonuclease NrnB/cAMP/cGMP phosphodiesterase (DHH superfamily)
MENKKKIHVFAHADLDGAACYLVLHWYLWNDPTYTITNHYNLRNDVSKWLLKNDPSKYDDIYFVALDTCEIADLIDFNNVRIFDHHQEANRCKELYKNANFNILELGSTVLGLYRYLKVKYSERKISAQQRKFVALVDDYVSYRLLERELSIGLNMIYWNYQGDKIEKLKKDFDYGFDKFDDKQLTIIDFYKRKIDKIINEAEFYTGDFKIQGIFRKVISTFANTCINEVAAELTKLGYEIAIVVNTDTKKVSFRKNHFSNVDLPKLAKKICQGGGYKNTAGGLITKEFLAFTKLLEKHDIGTRK